MILSSPTSLLLLTIATTDKHSDDESCTNAGVFDDNEASNVNDDNCAQS